MPQLTHYMTSKKHSTEELEETINSAIKNKNIESIRELISIVKDSMIALSLSKCKVSTYWLENIPPDTCRNPQGILRKMLLCFLSKHHEKNIYISNALCNKRKRTD